MIREPTALNGARRARELDELASAEVDVLVVGGGVTGAGVALDAVSRGLSVALVEARDLAWGTSRFSSKLVHGGLRYLATGDVGVARESARERHLLMTRIAPHLVRPLGQLVPVLPGVSARQVAASAIGMSLGDLLRRGAGTPSSALPSWRRTGAGETLRLAPALAPGGLRGGLLGHDGQLVDDARLVVALARTAAGLGARVLTRVRVDRIRPDSADLTCAVTGERLTARARVVISATGVWAGALDPSVRLRPSRGTHLVIPAARLGNPGAGLMVPLPGSVSRFVFALPQQHGRVFVGLTDEEAPGPVPDVADPTPAEIEFLLRTVSRVLQVPLTSDDVVGAYAGLRPLVDTVDDGAGGRRSSDVSRRHLVTVSAHTGAVNVLGGKLTTYRQMAEDAVDAAVGHAGLAAGPCRTRTLPLVGAPGAVPGAAPAGMTEGLWAEVVARHGAEARRVVDGARTRSATAAVGHLRIARAEIEWAITHEGALDADDVLDRRTRIGLVPADRSALAEEIEEIVAAV
ncbi:glycerol-3-phosphate dehydrogenase/oxidase [Myceligenerans pegani]|uniref:Glycerol-3-phosphate dehydrogenase n=1 Tax=Myceligenerans pegani TaxID=2776917 RepID=A0ABR9N215_9MICO|nr:glycerol-3-phosphate dehydrogenase/oxidase [Myceligenerans sp. TRM 65318]MBE1877684.1 glycerol-3-phosphate dehydrogenase/oxidase [Myceligenerans sp. TRM 65318]MBE3019955.1 glycerol-3-phosphate dehydrogenase/oxidase [Myceligenerans sp. TRM 65318]